MKTYCVLIFSILFTCSVRAQLDTNDFVTTWKTDNIGSSNDSSITIYTDPAYLFNYDVDWNNDGIFDSLGVTADITYTYPAAGTYTIRIRGSFPSIKFGANGNLKDAGKLISIDQWGNVLFYDLSNAFFNCNSLGYAATDKPNFNPGCNASFMFAAATSFNGDIRNWDVSSVTNMSNMFAYAISFNGDIGSWDVSNVTDMSSMFNYANSFNQNLNNWDVSSVTNMSYMFSTTNLFNSNISNWDVSSVTDMSGMFSGTAKFNRDISMWGVSSVTNMNSMFHYAIMFNQNISSWNVSSVTDMSAMFDGASLFNGDISNWDVSSVTNMSNMFTVAGSFNKDIGSWDVSSVTDMSGMFQLASSFNSNISSWDVSSVTNMSIMFDRAGSFNRNLGNWNVQSVSQMTHMLFNSGMSVQNYDSTLIAWQAKPHQLNVSIGVGGLEYCLADSARTLLIADGWVFTGDSKNCLATSVEEEPFKNNFSIFPNPSNGVFTVELLQNLGGQEIQIINSFGQVLKSINIVGNESTQIDLSELPEGMYYMNINGQQKKLVLVK